MFEVCALFEVWTLLEFWTLFEEDSLLVLETLFEMDSLLELELVLEDDSLEEAGEDSLAGEAPLEDAWLGGPVFDEEVSFMEDNWLPECWLMLEVDDSLMDDSLAEDDWLSELLVGVDDSTAEDSKAEDSIAVGATLALTALFSSVVGTKVVTKFSVT